MRLRIKHWAVTGLLAAGLAGAYSAAEPEGRLDADKIGRAADVKATTAPDGVVRIARPRTDVSVRVDGMPLAPFAGLGSWAAFTPAKHGAMVMGDTVVFQDEVTPAMDAAFAHGLEVTGCTTTSSSTSRRCISCTSAGRAIRSSSRRA
jgi:hypothetical protein